MNTADITCVKMPEEINSFSKKSTWYNRVYLCYENVPYNKPNSSLPIEGFKCVRYNSFGIADYKFKTEINKNIRYTMIPICKWVPQIFDKYILDWTLRNLYWIGNHNITHEYNSSFKEK